MLRHLLVTHSTVLRENLVGVENHRGGLGRGRSAGALRVDGAAGGSVRAARDRARPGCVLTPRPTPDRTSKRVHDRSHGSVRRQGSRGACGCADYPRQDARTGFVFVHGASPLLVGPSSAERHVLPKHCRAGCPLGGRRASMPSPRTPWLSASESTVASHRRWTSPRRARCSSALTSTRAVLPGLVA